MTKKLLTAAAFALLLVALLAFIQPATPRQWEYTSTTSEKKLNEMGLQGWELVATTSYYYQGAGEQKTFYFKRAK
jgi:hypothetical protein